MATTVKFGTSGWPAIMAEKFSFANVRLAVPLRVRALLCCAMVARRGKPLGQQLEEPFGKVGSFYPQRENFRLTWEVKEKFTEKLQQHRTIFLAGGLLRPSEPTGSCFCSTTGSRFVTGLREENRWCGCITRRAGSRGLRQFGRGGEIMDLRVGQLSKIRRFPRPEQGLRVLAECAPQAEAFAERSAHRLRPVLDWFYGARRRLATGGVLLLTAWLFVHVVFGANGMVVYRQKVSEYKGLEKQVKTLKDENQSDAEQIKALQSDPETIEKEAREQLHYTRPGEVVYVSPAPPPKPSSPELKDAQK